MTLEVIGRKSGRVVSLPVVVALVGGQRYLVSMLGDEAQWVQNVRAAGGRAAIRSGRRSEVFLEEVPVAQRAPILKAYLQRAPGARPHAKTRRWRISKRSRRRSRCFASCRWERNKPLYGFVLLARANAGG